MRMKALSGLASHQSPVLCTCRPKDGAGLQDCKAAGPCNLKLKRVHFMPLLVIASKHASNQTPHPFHTPTS